MKKIKLTKGKYASVDDEDFEYLNQWKWYAKVAKHTSYACRLNSKNETVWMHRVITQCPDGLDVDHINYNGLNNRRDNLRVCTRQQNELHKKPRKGYKGVFYIKSSNKWMAQIKINYKAHYLGCYSNKKNAALIYDYKAYNLDNEFAYLNFPSEFLSKKEFNYLRYPKYNEKIVGVHKRKSGRWRSYITINKKRINIGTFDNKKDAALARNEYIINNNLNNIIKLNFGE